MDRDKLQLFVSAAEAELSSVRGSLLIVSQTGDTSDLAMARSSLDRLRIGAEANGQGAFAALGLQCEAEMGRLASALAPGDANSALDIVAEMEAALWAIPALADDFDFDVGGFVDESFDRFVPKAVEHHSEDPIEEFEIDDETLEIFRAEADELLTNIDGGLRALAMSPDDQTALWEIRRNAHTFKGAAGIVGLKDACHIAHQMEDLLDKMVEMGRGAAPAVIEFLENSAGSLASIVAARADENAICLKASYEKAMSLLSSPSATASGQNGTSATQTDLDHRTAVTPSATPIVRVSLDRLDEIITLSHQLSANRAELSARFADLDPRTGPVSLALVRNLFEMGQTVADEIQTKLRRIRMVKFSTLETRLSRAVNVTCHDESKKAVVEIENGAVEIDTLMMDVLIEPLLHLLKNAVVHGIERPETRRLIGKPERGHIRIRLDADEKSLALSISDDGGGISIPKLKAEAVAKGLIDEKEAVALDDGEALRLIFERGFTTAEKLDLNAGRGVGMSIVKESVETRGGTVTVKSEPRKGTTFNIHLPLAIAESLSQPAEESETLTPPLVLVVDDSPSVRHQTTKLVEEAGFRVITAENGAEALELLLSGEWLPDLIFSDVEMPQVDGWAFLEYVKTDENLGHIPVVMVTSLDSDEHRMRAFDLGAAEYVVKPFKAEDLEKTFKHICPGAFPVHEVV